MLFWYPQRKQLFNHSIQIRSKCGECYDWPLRKLCNPCWDHCTQVELSQSRFRWNQSLIFCFERGVTVIMTIELWKRLLRQEIEWWKKKEEYELILKKVKEIINEHNCSLTFNSKLEASISKCFKEEHQARKQWTKLNNNCLRRT